MKRRIFSLFMAMAMMFTLLAGCSDSGNNGSPSNSEGSPTAGDDTVYTLKYATIRSADHSIEVLVQEYLDMLTEESDGRLQFETYFDGSLGTAREIAEACMNGTIDMYWGGSGDLTNYAPVAEILTNPPFLYKDPEHASRCLDAVWGDVESMINDAGLMPLYYSYQGTRQLISTKPVYTIEDMKGLSKRTVNTEYFMGLIKALGAEPAAIDLSELYTAIQTGVVDAGGGDLDMIYTKNWNEVAKYLTMYNMICVHGIMTMNLSAYEELPADLQQLMIDDGKKMVEKGIESVSAGEEATLQKLIDAGVEVIYPTDEAMEGFRNAVTDYAADYAKSLGDDVAAVYQKMSTVE